VVADTDRSVDCQPVQDIGLIAGRDRHDNWRIGTVRTIGSDGRRRSSVFVGIKITKRCAELDADVWFPSSFTGWRSKAKQVYPFFPEAGHITCNNRGDL
jgi:hypothetical protein